MNHNFPTVTHLGGESSVTGSCHLLQVKGLNILVDCGIAQGNDYLYPMENWSVSPSELDFLFFTHAHMDHIGRLTEFIQNGFKGEIITTTITWRFLDL